MSEIVLSESAVAVLRFHVKRWRMTVRDRDQEAFRELVRAGIMEADGADFRFTQEGWARREEWLSAAEDRIERERFDPPDASHLSESARALLSRMVDGEHVAVTPQNREAFRELAAARIILLLHTFARGDESDYRFTYWGYRLRFEILGRGTA